MSEGRGAQRVDAGVPASRKSGGDGGQRPVALTVAGSDPSGGAGIQADLKTFTVHAVYGASVITALTAQNSTGVRGVLEIPASFVSEQLKAVRDDLCVAALKTGMLGSAEVVKAVAEGLASPEWLGGRPKVVVDPVMVSTSEAQLLASDAIGVLREQLFPLADLVTPNLQEAAILSSRDPARSIADMAEQGRIIFEAGPKAVLIKGGHLSGPAGDDGAIDVLVTADGVRDYRSERIASVHTHGSGCTLSAAICAFLAKGADLFEAIAQAKVFVSAAIASAAQNPVGQGRAPLDHFANTKVGD